jgi:tRNA(Ile)-lysidine synthase
MDGRTPQPAVPVSPDEADAAFTMLSGRTVLLGVSGGPDSIALMGLMTGWARQRGHALPAVAVVDHGLRAASADEAVFVVASAEALGLAAAILPWAAPKPVSALQDSARRARYRLLAAHARAIGADMLVTAHTEDVQAVTLMMRLASGSGLTGLAGMRQQTRSAGIAHARPALGWSKARLIATCRQHGWGWSNDPSNADQRFARVRWRGILPVLAAEGLDAGRLGVLARRLAAADEALDEITERALQACRIDATDPGWQLDFRRLAGYPSAIVMRALGRMLSPPGGQGTGSEDAIKAEAGLRLQRLEACTEALLDALRAGRAVRRTLGGQILALDREGLLGGRPEGPRRRGSAHASKRTGDGGPDGVTHPVGQHPRRIPR